MAHPISHPKMTMKPSKLSTILLHERGIALITALAVVLLTSLGQVSIIGAIIIIGVATTLLLRMEIRRHTERLRLRRSEIRHKRKEEQGVQSFRAQALNSLPSPVLLINDEHKIIFANNEAVNALGVGSAGDDAYLFLRQPSLMAQIDAALAGKTLDEASEDVRYTTSAERSFDVSVASFGDVGEDSQTMLAMVFFYEVTSLLSTERMRVDFVANASHELRTPLASLMGSIETLQGPAKDDPEAQERFLNIMQRESERMTRLIDDLLSLSRIELDRHKAPDTVITLERVAQFVINSVEPIARERNIKFAIHMTADLPNVIADEDQIIQVLLNLFVNAAKYADAGTTVHISGALNDTGSAVEVNIRDEGPGIAPQHLARLTERFYRVDTARSRKMGGTGLGLAIVKHILLRHETPLEIKSELGKGTQFTFFLKNANRARPNSRHSSGALTKQPSHNISAL